MVREMSQKVQTPLSKKDLELAHVWTRSFKRLKRAIAASEDNNPESEIDEKDANSGLDFPGLPINREK